MAKLAVIKTGGKQYKVQEGKMFRFEKIEAEVGETVKFETLLVAAEDGSALELGQPTLGEKVEGKVIETAQGKKVQVIKYKSKTRYHRNVGHRQMFTKVEITKIA